MKRFVFSLEQVLKHKARREQLAEMLHLRALAALHAREAAAQEWRGRLQVAGTKLPDGSAGLDLHGWLTHVRHVERLGRELAAAEHLAREAARAAEEARVRYRRQAQEAEALRQLRRRQHERHTKEAAKADQRFLDELGLRRWLDPDTAALRGQEGMP